MVKQEIAPHTFSNGISRLYIISLYITFLQIERKHFLCSAYKSCSMDQDKGNSNVQDTSEIIDLHGLSGIPGRQ